VSFLNSMYHFLWVYTIWFTLLICDWSGKSWG